jgi:hypothetical protein
MAKFNALKTGAYARTNLLPYENAQEFDKLRAEIFADLRSHGRLETEIVETIVENRWLRCRQRLTTAIAMHRHPFGRTLEESNAKSWREAIAVVRQKHDERHRALESLANAWCRCAESVATWTKKSDSDQLEEYAQRFVDMWERCLKKLTSIEARLDDEDQFFAVYSPKQLERRIAIENSLDAQFDKLRARLVIEQEARILRDKLQRTQDDAGDSAVKRSDDGPKPPPRDQMQPSDEAELDRDDDDFDPLADFVAESPVHDAGGAGDSGEP